MTTFHFPSPTTAAELPRCVKSQRKNGCGRSPDRATGPTEGLKTRGRPAVTSFGGVRRLSPSMFPDRLLARLFGQDSTQPRHRSAMKQVFSGNQGGGRRVLLMAQRPDSLGGLRKARLSGIGVAQRAAFAGNACHARCRARSRCGRVPKGHRKVGRANSERLSAESGARGSQWLDRPIYFSCCWP